MEPPYTNRIQDTDLAAKSPDVIGRYGPRSSIEVTHHETKQLLRAGDTQCWSELSVARTPLFAYWAYSLVVLWFVRDFRTARGLMAQPGPWYRHEKSFSFSDMLAAARRSHFKIRFMKEVSQHGALPRFNAARSTRHANYAINATLALTSYVESAYSGAESYYSHR